jgi:hypothetical protein
MRKSISHPLQIAVVTAGYEFGWIGITFCPGKYDPHAVTGAWNRDLNRDLDTIRDWGAAAVVRLLELKELKLLRVEDLGEKHRAETFYGSIFPSLTVYTGRTLRAGVGCRWREVAFDPAQRLRRAGPLPRRAWTSRHDSSAAFGRTRYGAVDSDRKCARGTTGRDRDH